MSKVTIYARNGDKFYRLVVSRRWAIDNDNGAIFSCGLTVGTDITESQLKSLISHHKATEVDKDVYDHSGCRSSCVKRGGNVCRW